MKVPRQLTSRIGSILLIASGVFIVLCLLTYSPADVPLLSSHPTRPPYNLGGIVGIWLAFFGRGLFGWASFVLPVLCILWAWRLWLAKPPEIHIFSFTIAIVCLLASIGTLLALGGINEVYQANLGGMAGFIFARAGNYYLGIVGTLLSAICVSLLSWIVVSGQLLHSDGLGFLRRFAQRLSASLRHKEKDSVPSQGSIAAHPRTSASSEPAASSIRSVPSISASSQEDNKATFESASSMRVRIRSSVSPASLKAKPAHVQQRLQTPSDFQLPSLDLLANPPPISSRQINDDLQMNARVLIETLREFGIEANVVNIDRGPAVTRYELTPAPGVKLTKIVSLADDLALVMKAASCHIVAPIPGKGTVGIDVPNSTTTMVYLKEIITAPEFTASPSPLALPIGKGVSGHAILADLRECPHLLIAGATGSGKTVCLNSLLTGILLRSSPAQVRFLMVDPKMVELALFNDIPHLIAPVVTNAKKASVALNWAVQEMERRYQLLAKAGVRNIDLYNARALKSSGASAMVLSGSNETASDDSSDEEKPLPFLVVVIDELADLMMIASQDVEGAITRLAQLSRAVGIHIILATQRPSVDVITGVIKANFPARIAFQVASKVDSRTILDMNGADKLLGKGDLLFLRPGSAKPIRAQGSFVTDAEIEKITAFLKQTPPSYDEQLLEKARHPEGMLITEKDELYEMAKQIVLDTGQASTSLLQRRLRLGYGRAARILDLMEQEGLIGPPQGSRPREILINRDAVKSA